MSEAPAILSINVRSLDEMLDANGSPLLELRIHPDVARSLRSHAERLHSKAPLEIEVVTPAEDIQRQAEAAEAIHWHFHEEELDAAEELRELGRKGFWNVLVAMVVVAIFVCLSEAVLRLGEGRIVSVLSESLIIVAWVTLWGPAETLLFARFPIRRKRAIAHALSQAAVKLRAR